MIGLMEFTGGMSIILTVFSVQPAVGGAGGTAEAEKDAAAAMVHGHHGSVACHFRGKKSAIEILPSIWREEIGNSPVDLAGRKRQ
jgi:hypothetical protein